MMACGLAVASAGFAVLTRLDGGPSATVLVMGSVIFSLGFTPVIALTTDLVVGAAPSERAGSAAALSETSLEFGGALGIAVLGSVATALYRGRMAEAAAGLPPEAAEAARSTLGRAVTVAQQAPPDLAGPLLDEARDAFAAGIQLNATMAMVGLLALAMMVLIRLRRLPVARH
jgi:DHA2 family multidrug resistance protein-like MFS transporter